MKQLCIYREPAPDENIYLRLVGSVDGRIFVAGCNAAGTIIGQSFLEITTAGIILYPMHPSIPIERDDDGIAKVRFRALGAA